MHNEITDISNLIFLRKILPKWPLFHEKQASPLWFVRELWLHLYQNCQCLSNKVCLSLSIVTRSRLKCFLWLWFVLKFFLATFKICQSKKILHFLVLPKHWWIWEEFVQRNEAKNLLPYLYCMRSCKNTLKKNKLWLTCCSWNFHGWKFFGLFYRIFRICRMNIIYNY